MRELGELIRDFEIAQRTNVILGGQIEALCYAANKVQDWSETRLGNIMDEIDASDAREIAKKQLEHESAPQKESKP